MSSLVEEILTGVGELYLAPVGTAKPDLEDVPGAAWTALGYTDGGVTLNLEQKIDEHRVDQETGAVEASRSEESLKIETSLAEVTLENLGRVLGRTVAVTAAASGVIGKRSVGLYRGAAVQKYALLYRGSSAYGAFPAQYYVPVCYFGGNIKQEYKKDGKVLIPCEFNALVNPNASSEAEKFGVYEMQDAEATA